MAADITLETLALFSLKCSPRVFDLSSGQAHVSIRDQIVRGRLLARDLKAADKACGEVLVVGAGVAGVSFAVAAACQGIRVTVVDVNPRPFALQHATSSRWVGPFMYEWPAGFFEDQSYPPLHPSLKALVADPFVPSWSATAPIRASNLALALETWLTKLLSLWSPSSPLPLLLASVDSTAVSTFVKGFFGAGSSSADIGGTDWPSGAKLVNTVQPDYVVLAAGMGPENTTLPGKASVSGKRFWENDNLKSPGSEHSKIGIFGGGDGALQDVLRALTVFDHPIHFIEHLRSTKAVALALDAEQPALLSIEQQNRLFATWTSGHSATQEVDARCRAIARRLASLPAVRRKVKDGLRKGRGRVRLIWDQPHFTKAYLLNRFLVHLIEESRLAAPGLFASRMQLTLSPSTTVVSADAIFLHKYRVNLSGAAGVAKDYFDEVVVRFGPMKGSAPGLQMIGLSAPTADRTLLAQIPVPYVLPAL